jgi:hypothetical protein
LANIQGVQSEGIDIFMNHTAQLIDILPTDLGDQLRDTRSILIERGSQNLQRVPIGAAGVKPDIGIHRCAGSMDPLVEWNFVIAKTSCSVNIW